MPTQKDMDKLRADALAKIKELEEERDTWKARAFAMFWKLPGDLTIGELQDDAERARAFIGACT